MITVRSIEQRVSGTTIRHTKLVTDGVIAEVSTILTGDGWIETAVFEDGTPLDFTARTAGTAGIHDQHERGIAFARRQLGA